MTKSSPLKRKRIKIKNKNITEWLPNFNRLRMHSEQQQQQQSTSSTASVAANGSTIHVVVVQWSLLKVKDRITSQNGMLLAQKHMNCMSKKKTFLNRRHLNQSSYK